MSLSRITLILVTLQIILYAKGVDAGTVIENRATLSYSFEGKTRTLKSNIAKSIVAQLIDPKVSWIDLSEVGVLSGEKNRVLSFIVENSGNGKDSFSLSTQTQEYRSKFFPKKRLIYIDSNQNSRFDIQDKIVDSIKLDADEQRLIFVVSDISQKVTLEGDPKSYITLRATSKIGGSGKRGKVHPKAGVRGVDAIDGINGGIAEDVGVYKLLKSNVLLKKSVKKVAKDSFLVVVDLQIVGKSAIKDLLIEDKIAKETTYVKNSLTLDERHLSDQKDGDEGYILEDGNISKVIVNLSKQNCSAKHKIAYIVNYTERGSR